MDVPNHCRTHARQWPPWSAFRASTIWSLRPFRCKACLHRAASGLMHISPKLVELRKRSDSRIPAELPSNRKLLVDQRQREVLTKT
jgi:hypothetical protein